jgi:hypothetical protein
MSEWQPIETAPQDQELLVLRRDGVMHVAKISGISDKFGILSADFGNATCTFFFPIGDNYDSDGDVPTHWMPLPEPPDAG